MITDLHFELVTTSVSAASLPPAPPQLSIISLPFFWRKTVEFLLASEVIDLCRLHREALVKATTSVRRDGNCKVLRRLFLLSNKSCVNMFDLAALSGLRSWTALRINLLCSVFNESVHLIIMDFFVYTLQVFCILSLCCLDS